MSGTGPDPKEREGPESFGCLLLVDDADFFRGKVTSLLRSHGVGDIVEAETGREALALFQSRRFDAVLLDVALPDVDGLSVLKVMRKLNDQIPVLIVTAAASLDVVKGAKRSGAAGVLAKPVEEERLLRTVKSLLDRK